MVDLLAHTQTKKNGAYRRRILAAGEMLELGPDSPKLHRDSGRYAASKRIDCIVAVQGDAAELANGAIEAGLPSSQVHFFGDSAAAALFLADFVKAGDLLLVKGSRGVKMERIAEALRGKYPLVDEVHAPVLPQGSH
jgi:UDP-N-acetylmuramoyl-tripeptide--D-alanyl-D-alanine ligase